MNILSSISMHTSLPLWAVWLFALAALLLGAGRLTRVIYYDDFPPSMWLRVKWDALTEESTWNKLIHCPWCLGMWVGVFAGAWFGVGLVVDWIMVAWWIVWGFLAIGYLIPMIIVRDEPADNE